MILPGRMEQRRYLKSDCKFECQKLQKKLPNIQFPIFIGIYKRMVQTKWREKLQDQQLYFPFRIHAKSSAL